MTITEFLGVRFNALSLDAALAAIVARADRHESFAYVATPNVDHVVGLAREPARAALYDSAWLTLNDSRVLEAMAAASGRVLPATPGADIVERLFEEEIAPHEPVTIIGGDADTIEALIARYGLTNVHWHRAPMNLKHDPIAIANAAGFIAANPTRFVFLCVGAPQQEMVAWAASVRGDATGVGICCGASLEFLSGRAKRAPHWMRKARLEWLHRLGSEPRRLARRYLVDGPRVLPLLGAQLARDAMAPRSAA